MRSAHADEFREHFRRALALFDEESKHILKLRQPAVAQAGINSGDPVAASAALAVATEEANKAAVEEHVCFYLLTRTLLGLNWGIDPDESIYDPSGQPVLMREAPLKSIKNADIRLDYLGYLAPDDPLIVVEGKSPAVQFPASRQVTSPWERRGWLAERFVATLQHPSKPVNKEWSKILEQASEYVGGVKNKFGKCPQRHVITNGDWFVVFRDPEAVLQSRSNSSDSVSVFLDRRDVLCRHREFFEMLDFRAVSPSIVLRKTEMYGHAAVAQALRVFRGMLLRYDALEPENGECLPPQMLAKPILFLEHISGQMFRVEDGGVGEYLAVPSKPAELERHLQEMKHRSDALLNATIGVNPKLSLGTLVDFYANESVHVAGARGVRVLIERRGPNATYAVVLGQDSHFIQASPDKSGCGYHSAGGCGDKLVKKPGGLPIIDPRSYFREGTAQLCQHAKPDEIKQKEIVSNPGQRRSNSGFCEIAPFEERLCCRSCSFFGVCKTWPHFRDMPCPEHPGP